MIREGTKLWQLFRWLAPRKQNICITFGTPQGKATLRYLAKFCFAEAPCKTERDQGKRDVWLFLMSYLRLDEEELAVLYGALSPEQRYQLYKPSVSFTEEN
jgi:hypothetical protein